MKKKQIMNQRLVKFIEETKEGKYNNDASSFDDEEIASRYEYDIPEYIDSTSSNVILFGISF
jgi:hypothetical protein